SRLLRGHRRTFREGRAQAADAGAERDEREQTLKSYKNFVNGDFVEAVDGRDEEILNPANEKPVAKVPTCGEKDVDRAVAAAAGAFETWGDSTPADRAAALLKLADVIEKNGDELASLEAENV